MKLYITLFFYIFIGFQAFGQDYDKLPLSVRNFLYSERYRMDRSANDELLTPDKEKLDPRYSPEGKKLFKVKGYYIDAAKFEVFEHDFSREIKDLFIKEINGRKHVLLVVHPQSEAFYRNFLLENGVNPMRPHVSMWAAPTASSRSLVTWVDGNESRPFMTKVSLDIVIGEAPRTIKGGEIARSVGHSKIIDTAQRDGMEIEYFKEPFGIMPKGMKRGGMLVREFPKELISGQMEVAPLFSLYGVGDTQERPLLLSMIEQSNLSLNKFLETKIFRPFARQWLYLAIDHGIYMEAHAQNITAVIQNKNLAGEFIFRDLGGFTIDIKYRARRGLLLPNELPILNSFERDYVQNRHRYEMSGSIEYYFVGGFVYNLDRYLKQWQEQGLLKTKPLRKGQIEALFLRIMREEYKAKTGETLVLNRSDYSQLTKAVYRARRKLYPETRNSCKQIYGDIQYLSY